MKSLRRSLNNTHNGHGHSAGGSSGGGGHGHGHSNSQGNAIPVPVVSSPSATAAGFAAVGVSEPTMSYANPLTRPTEKVAPPKKVIKALRNHRSTNPQELSYHQGDFWYVTGERDGWYEALNPITGSRGLVPKDDFEEFVKGGRQASAGAPPQTPTSAQYARTPSQSNIIQSQTGASLSPTAMVQPPSPQTAQHAHIAALQGKKHQPLYAIVQYDFHAERPDELEARAGEPIVVIAQSNHEWFVAKPIGRLGGPGLIPVAFVEIRDPVTGKAVEVFPSTIPQVEEWKKATADYKAAAIPLGRLDLAPNQSVANSPFAAQAAQAAQHQQQMQPQPQHSGREPHLQHVSGASIGSNRTGGSKRSGSPTSTNGGPATSARQTSQQGSSVRTPHSPVGYHPDVDNMLPPGELTQLAVPSFHNESGNYWFRLSAVFVPDERTAPAYTLILYRTYEDFYDFQITLLDTFPTEAGRPRPGEEHEKPPERILPYMPGPVDEEIDDELTEYRRDELDAYVRALLDLHGRGAEYIMRHDLIRTFFAAKYGDYCEETSRNEAIEELQDRMGDVSFESGPPSSSTSTAGIHHVNRANEPSPHTPPHATGPVPPTRANAYNNSNNHQPYAAQAQQQQQQQQQPGHLRNDSRGNGGPMPSDVHDTPRGNAQQQQQQQHYRAGSSSNAPHAGAWTSSPSTTTGPSFASQVAAATGIGNPNMSAVTPMLPLVATAPTPVVAPSPAMSSTGALAPPPLAATRAAAAPGAGGGAAFIKIKIYDRATDDLIALRVHPNVSYAELLDKVRARLGPEVSVLQYRVGGGAGGASRQIVDDRGLAEWMSQEERLVLYAEQ